MNFLRFKQKGSVFILMAITIPFLLLSSAIAVDVGALYVQRSHMQNIADAAALAGASQLQTSESAAKSLAQNYGKKNGETIPDGQITFLTDGTTKKIRVDINKDAPLLFFKYFQDILGTNIIPPFTLTVHAIAASTGNTPGIFDHSIISGGTGTFYLLGQYGSGNEVFKGPIHVNGTFQFDRNSENGYGSDNLPSGGIQINAPISISARQYNIGGLNKPANQVFTSDFTYGTPTIDITANNPVIAAKITSLTNTANTFSSNNIASAAGGSAINALAATTPLYVNGSLSYTNIISGPYGNSGIVKNDLVIVTTSDMNLSFTSVTFDPTATITLISLNGNITINNSPQSNPLLHVNMLAPKGSITIQGGGPETLDGYLIAQNLNLGNGNITYKNSKGSTSGSSNGNAVSLVE
ncbi:Putative Flp pilus-assembly TadE/G-like [Propionispira arboris]|uniref:Putative Flp pilus-assembly TadE/G-like n=1 Tax=Propionispira arboris TaxID=84035 RepID=A0A1H7BTD7_9FIRM|nr:MULTISPECIES: pilus assembly protein TadG-related protein [Propionispira]SEJ79597.1 Putative Flp pilus-assembly TadE/G-like [Propionispira arboris]